MVYLFAIEQYTLNFLIQIQTQAIIKKRLALQAQLMARQKGLAAGGKQQGALAIGNGQQPLALGNGGTGDGMNVLENNIVGGIGGGNNMIMNETGQHMGGLGEGQQMTMAGEGGGPFGGAGVGGGGLDMDDGF
jgi:hypothetical protein